MGVMIVAGASIVGRGNRPPRPARAYV